MIYPAYNSDISMQLTATLAVTLIGFLATLILLLAYSLIRSCAGGPPFPVCFRRGAWFLLTAPAGMLIACFIGCNIYVVRDRDIFSDTLPESFEGYTIAQISDIHLLSYKGRKASLRHAVRKILRQDPDMIVFTGDLVTLSSKETDSFVDILSDLRARDGVYAVMGNHDYCTYAFTTGEEKKEDEARVRRIIGEMGWKLLENEWIDIEREDSRLTLIGGEGTTWTPEISAALDSTLKACPPADFKILLYHDPNVWRPCIVGKTDVDLTLSGHTHAMQLEIFGWTPSRYVFNECHGLYEDGGQWLYVNSGLGETGVLARLGAWPEISVFRLKRR